MDPLASVNAGWEGGAVPAPAAAPASPTTSTSPSASRTASSPTAPTIREPQVYGDPGTTLIHPPNDKPAMPFLRVRIGALERNRKDLLIRYDASVSTLWGVGCVLGASLSGCLAAQMSSWSYSIREILLPWVASSSGDSAIDPPHHHPSGTDHQTNLPNFRTSLYRNMQRSYVEFQRFAEQAQLVCPQSKSKRYGGVSNRSHYPRAAATAHVSRD